MDLLRMLLRVVRGTFGNPISGAGWRFGAIGADHEG
jgi:hypothetical protein